MASADAAPSYGTSGRREEIRLDIARAEYPRVLLWGGVLILLLTVLTYIEEPEAPRSLHVVDALVAGAFVAVGAVMRRVAMPGPLLPWLFAVTTTSLVIAVLYHITIDQKAIGFAYVAVALTAMGPTTLFWIPYLASASVSMIAVTFVATNWEGAHPSEWQLLTLASALVGMILLRSRLRSIGALADATVLAEQRSVTDELTGLLNRHGLYSQLPRLIAMATRLQQPVFVVFVDIDGLKLANDRHGHAFGDEVIQAAGHAVLASFRGGDLVARWGGDELLVAGLGHHPDRDALARRLDEHVSATGIDREQWPGHLSVGFAEGDPSRTSIDDLIAEADADMYRRRRDR